MARLMGFVHVSMVDGTAFAGDAVRLSRRVAERFVCLEEPSFFDAAGKESDAPGPMWIPWTAILAVQPSERTIRES